jgi:hypothetical protein
MSQTYTPHITTGRTRLHTLLANREISEGDYLVECDDEDYEEFDDQELDDVGRSALALSVNIDWDDMGLRVMAIDWDEYPERLQHPTESGFRDAVNEMVSEAVEDGKIYSDDDDEDVFSDAIDRLPETIDEMTPSALRTAIQEAVDAAWAAEREEEGAARIARLREIYDAADDGGTISAAAMVELFPGQPNRHCDSSMEQAAKWSGIEVDSVTEELGL